MAMYDPTKRRWYDRNLLGLIFVLLWASLMLRFAYREIEAYEARNIIRKFLNRPDHEFVVTVRQRIDSADADVLNAMRTIHWSMPHHTYPDHEIPIVIRYNQASLELTLARDSALPNEYWVFWTREEGDPNRLDIGRIKTSLLDGE